MLGRAREPRRDAGAESASVGSAAWSWPWLWPACWASAARRDGRQRTSEGENGMAVAVGGREKRARGVGGVSRAASSADYSAFEVGDERLHLGDLAALRLDDLVGELAHARVRDLGARARGQDGDGVVRDHRLHPGHVLHRLLAARQPHARRRTGPPLPAKMATLAFAFLYMFSMNAEHDDRHRGAHVERHEGFRGAPPDVVPHVDRRVHESEHDERRGRRSSRRSVCRTCVHGIGGGRRTADRGLRVFGKDWRGDQRVARARGAPPTAETSRARSAVLRSRRTPSAAAWAGVGGAGDGAGAGGPTSRGRASYVDAAAGGL